MTDVGRSLVAVVMVCEKYLLAWGCASKFPAGAWFLLPALEPRKAAKAAMVSGVHAK
jgi:hypothetical protein